MDIRTLKQNVGQILRGADQPPKRLVLIHTGIALGVSLLLGLISFVLDRGVSIDGGLSGMDTQVALATVQTVLGLASMVAMPFWQAGLVFAAIGYLRGRRVETRDLTAGFRRFKPILTSGLMMGLQYLGRGFVGMYISSTLVVMTPFAAPAYKLTAMLQENPNLDLSTVNMEGMETFLAAYLVIFLVVYAALILPVFYRYRMVPYVIMDRPEAGGIAAMFLSRAMMRGRRMKLFKLDLSFWWFYALELLLAAVSMGDMILMAAGVVLPVPAEAAYWGCQLLAAAGQLGLYYLAKPKLEVAYALCYESFSVPEEPKPRKPVAHPWQY